jgi:repressor LexA
VRYYLNLLEKEGHLRRSERISRGIEGMAKPSAPASAGIPLLGRVAAGPADPRRGIATKVPVEPGEMFGDRSGLFALRVRGDSMTGRGHHGGRLRHRAPARTNASAGEMVVALLANEATVKYYRPARGRVELVAANPAYEPIVVDQQAGFRILGVVKGVLRTVSR